MSPGRRVLVLTHTGRAEAVALAAELLERLVEHELQPVMLSKEAADLKELDGVLDRVELVYDPANACDDTELVIVLGGDGTILRAAELVRGTDGPLLGVNLGHVGFLAEREREDVAEAVERVARRDYTVEERMTIDVRVTLRGAEIGTSWAVNEASVEKANRQRVLEVVTEVDGRPVSNFGCDGVVMATPTGSTAYAFSAGGPIVSPNVRALIMTPVSAHMPFDRSLIVDAGDAVRIEVTDRPATVVIDGRDVGLLEKGDAIICTEAPGSARFVSLSPRDFYGILKAKFGVADR